MASSLLQSDTLLNQRSYYEASVQRAQALPPLQGQQRADVLVVGGGLAGLSAALELAEQDPDLARSELQIDAFEQGAAVLLHRDGLGQQAAVLCCV